MQRVLLLAAAIALTACSTTSPDVYQRGDAQRLSQVQDAVVPVSYTHLTLPTILLV